MTEQPLAATGAPEPTGIEAVDSVLDLVAGLDERPLDEHAAVFETAHQQLRSALDDPSAPSA